MDYLAHLLVVVLIYASLTVSLDLMIGHTGILTFGHASFYGIGAYATAILTVYAGLYWFSAMVLAFVVGALAAGRGQRLEDMGAAALDSLWQEAKLLLSTPAPDRS
jgi:ABC-type branched-subunit amino acid transport system permease subunit